MSEKYENCDAYRFDAQQAGREIIVFGAGQRGGRVAKEALEHGLSILYFMDNNSADQKKMGIDVLRPDDDRLATHKNTPVFISIADEDAREAVKSQCKSLGFSRLASTPWEYTRYYPVTGQYAADGEKVAYEILRRHISTLPDAETLGDALLSLLTLDDDSGGEADWEAVRDSACGDKARTFLHVLSDGLAKGTLNKACGACMDYIHSLSRGNVCHRALDVRMAYRSRVDTYIAQALLGKLCMTCFAGSADAQIAFLLMLVSEYADIAGYAYAAAARVELESGNIEAAFAFAKRAEIGGYTRLYMSHLHYDIGLAAKKAGMPLDSPAVLDDLRGWFCPFPFETYTISGFDFDSGTANIRVCECAANSELVVTDGKGWNSRAHQKMRASILDGSFRYCNRQSCPHIIRMDLYKKSAITYARTKNIIAQKKVVIPDARHVVLGYDRYCNLKCPSCRADFVHYSKEQIEALKNFADTEVIPLLEKTEMLALSRSGEALLSPHSLYILGNLSPAGNPKLTIYLTTNGSHDMRAKWKHLGAVAGLIKRISVSIDGAGKEVFEQLRYPAKWDAITNTMEFFAEKLTSGELEAVTVNFVMQKANFRQLRDILHLCIQWRVSNLRLSRIIDFDNLYSSGFRDKAVHLPQHPLHEDFLDEIQKLKNEIKRLRLNNVTLPKISFMEKQI